MYLGVDYYPEQWDETLMEKDMDCIVEMGANVIRIGEFAWHRMERREGEYDFSFFDEVIEVAAKKGLKVIFGTPTATPPAWLIRKYPDMLSVGEDGLVRCYGGRHVACYSNDKYIEYSRRIVTELVTHYKDEKNIIAWQIDNELGHEGSDICRCGYCRRKFDEFLRKKFNGDIDALNETYGTAFWSQEYNDFDEIPLPYKTITTHNPALRLDYERFTSENIEEFVRMQEGIIHSIISDATVIHDYSGGGLSKHVDYAAIARHIDKVAYNNYPVWGGQKKPIEPYETAFNLSYMRGLMRKNFLITEAIMGAQGHDITGFLPRPEQAKMWSYQSIAHGCDGLMYFRFRGAIKGAEQFCYGIIDADNRKTRKYYEVKEFFDDIRQYEDIISAPIKSDIAILYDYDSLASFRIQQQSILLNTEEEMKKYFRQFHAVNANVDILPASYDFSGYKAVIVTNMIIMKEDVLARLKEFVKGGGILIATYRTAIKDKDNNLVFGKVIPVDSNEFFGVRIAETESVQEYDCIPLKAVKGKLKETTAGIFRDMLEPLTSEVLYRYGDRFYDGYAAVTVNNFGKGKVFYIGTAPSEEVLREIADNVISLTGIEAKYTPVGVERVVRDNGRDRMIMLINHNAYEVTFEGKSLKPFGVDIVREPIRE